MQIISIQLLGRWGSMAILMYIQDAPLSDLPNAARNAMLHYSMSRLHDDFSKMKGKADRDRILIDRLVKDFNVQLKAATEQISMMKALEEAPRRSDLPSDLVLNMSTG